MKIKDPQAIFITKTPNTTQISRSDGTMKESHINTINIGNNTYPAAANQCSKMNT